VQFGTCEATVMLAADNYLIAAVPEGATGGALRVRMGSVESAPFPISLGTQIADNLHPVGNPAVDSEGNIYVTFSGQRGQKVPVSLYRITSNHVVKPFITELMNPTGLAIDRDGYLFVSCRHEGTIHRVSSDGRAMQWIEGMGTATGIAFDKAGNLYVGDRSGTIFKIGPDREIFVFATLEPSLSAYHLAFSPAGELFVTGPTTSSFERVYKISPAGECEDDVPVGIEERDGFASGVILLFEVRESFGKNTAFPFGELRSRGAMRFDQRCFHGEGFRLPLDVIRCGIWRADAVWIPAASELLLRRAARRLGNRGCWRMRGARTGKPVRQTAGASSRTPQEAGGVRGGWMA
jgi:hypothetical protein